MLNQRAVKINRREPGGDKISRVAQSKKANMEMAHAITTDLRKVNRPDFHFDESGGADYFGGV
ncbi:hypothetical protein MFMK1_001809 [Metallumcola ferriviriculae]|uniref:Uncharacterized protein n=1 Tax=Metallumcola ferriviriculae TaxID=3039180 RepID=A0AAU0URY2_9FIRM|nr:hypothetical protein MFMK1_001809 [Desulfitibacteraceae bacterium MK1]